MTSWAALIIAIIMIFIIAVTIANIVYYFDVRSGSCAAVSVNTATILMVLNIIILVIAAIILVWMLWLFFKKPVPTTPVITTPAVTTPVVTTPVPAADSGHFAAAPSTNPEQLRQEQLISSASAF